MVVVMFGVGLIVTVINQVWKLSVHAAVSAVAATVLTIVFGPWALALSALVVAICWSRVRLGDHTVAQVSAGAIAGAAFAAPAYLLMT